VDVFISAEAFPFAAVESWVKAHWKAKNVKTDAPTNNVFLFMTPPFKVSGVHY
jgi:hypothetical protein